MPTLRINVGAEAWPGVVALLIARYGEPEEGVTPLAFVEQIAAASFANTVAAAAEPPRQPAAKSKIRPSRAH